MIPYKIHAYSILLELSQRILRLSLIPSPLSLCPQQLFRSQQQQQLSAAVGNATQLQILQQQQYAHLQQQQQLAGLATPGATFAPPTPYIINPQDPAGSYVIASE